MPRVKAAGTTVASTVIGAAAASARNAMQAAGIRPGASVNGEGRSRGGINPFRRTYEQCTTPRDRHLTLGEEVGTNPGLRPRARGRRPMSSWLDQDLPP